MSPPVTLPVHLRRHAARQPHAVAISHRSDSLTWTELLAEVTDRARGMSGIDVVVLGDEHDHIDFVIRYLAGRQVGAPLVIGGDGPGADAVVRCVRDRADELRRICPGGPEVVFTSGSTARAKAVLLDGARMTVRAAQIEAVLGDPGGIVEVLSAPLRHSFGLGRLRCALLAGRTIRLTDRLPSPPALLDAEPAPAVLGLGLVSSAVKLLLHRHPRELARHAGRIARIEIASEPLEAEYRQQLVRLLPDTRLVLTYGMTELSRVAAVDLRRDPGGSSAGRPLPQTEIQVGADPNQLLTHGEGDFHVRGDCMVRAHLDGGEIRPVTRGTWLPTGDHGLIAADGTITVRGRRSETIKILGRQVDPEQTRQAVRRVADTADCLCLPVELTAGVCVLAALVVPVPGAVVEPAELHARLRGMLPAHQLPRRIVVVDDLPRLPNGKVDRRRAASLAAGRGAGV